MSYQNPLSILDFILSLENEIPKEIYIQILQKFNHDVREDLLASLDMNSEVDREIKRFVSLDIDNANYDKHINDLEHYKLKSDIDLSLNLKGSSLDMVEEELLHETYKIINPEDNI